jgi:ABC-type oligopeptide transport system ATPase subunit
LSSVLQLWDRLALLHEGIIAECTPVAQIEQMRHPATRSLLQSLPVPVSVLLSYCSGGDPREEIIA